MTDPTPAAEKAISAAAMDLDSKFVHEIQVHPKTVLSIVAGLVVVIVVLVLALRYL